MLADAGLDVVIVDRAHFPRDKTCAGWITPAVVETLALDLTLYGAGRTLQPIRGFRVGVIGGPFRDVDFESTVSYVVRRSEFDEFLLYRSGARLRLGTPVTSIERGTDGWIVNGEMEAPMLVGAGGHFCPVAAHFSRGCSPGALVLAQAVESTLPRQALDLPTTPALPTLAFCHDLHGYGWIVHKAGVVNAGFGRNDPDAFSHHLRHFQAWAIERGELPRACGDHWHGHAYLLHAAASRTFIRDGVLLAGDAAGLASPVSGEGIWAAVVSGLLAGRTIVAADGHFEASRLAGYAEDLDACLGPPLDTRRGRSWIPRRIREALGRRALASRAFDRRVLIGRWFLHRNAPPAPGARRAVAAR